MCSSVPTRQAQKRLMATGTRIRRDHVNGVPVMNLQISLAPILALLAGILILVQPRLLNYIVAIYLIVIGLLGLFGGRL